MCMPQELNCDHTVIELIMNNGVYSILTFYLCLVFHLYDSSRQPGKTKQPHCKCKRKFLTGKLQHVAVGNTDNNQVELL